MRQNNQQAKIKLHWKTKYKGRSFTKLPSVYSQPLYIYKGNICNIWVRHFSPATLSYAEVRKTLNETHTPFFPFEKGVTWAFTKLVLNPALLYKHTFGPTKTWRRNQKDLPARSLQQIMDLDYKSSRKYEDMFLQVGSRA